MTTDIFYDTSALAKHYHPETGTPVVDGLLTTPGSRHHISYLALTEIHATFAKYVRVGELTHNGFRLLTRRFEADVRGRRYKTVRLTLARSFEARLFIHRHALTRNLRTLDALQLAAALYVNRPGRPVTFVSADQPLCSIAAAEGLTVINPELP